MTTPSDWLLHFTSDDFGSPLGDGRPWGDGTEMAGRANPKNPDHRVPWDTGCTVDTYVGGQAAMDDYRTTLRAVIDAAKAAPGPAFANGSWQRGHVYIVDWRFNCLRDMSENTDPWALTPPATEDNTAIGLVRQLMQAGVQVRLMLWYPLSGGGAAAGLSPHMEDHRYAAALVEFENRRLMDTVFKVPPGSDPLGVVALDMRTADGRLAGSLHQKMMLVRTPTVDVAFAGGVDLAYTRRDAPQAAGDWQSGGAMPMPGPNWPHPADAAAYSSAAAATPRPTHAPGTDLPIDDGKGHQLFGPRQSWHDQHLKLTGPIVASLEWQFVERWQDSASFHWLGDDSESHQTSQQVFFSTRDALVVSSSNRLIRALPWVTPVKATGSSTVQMWRTIPWRDSRSTTPFRRAEFTVLAGISQSVNNARQLIWIFDQYFWSQSLGVQLHRQLRANPGLRVIIVLPPHADDPSNADKQHRARMLALTRVMQASGTSVANQVAVYSLWDSRPPVADKAHPLGRGIYVHAKVQMYDGALLVCGSANLNRRSLLCDAELAVAVADPAVVASHQKKLWNYLFPAGPDWPAPDFTTTGSGAKFFDDFAAAVGTTVSGVPGAGRLIIDPWQGGGPVLPAGADRPFNTGTTTYGNYYDVFMDPSSVAGACESHKPDAANNSEWQPADVVSDRLERQISVKGNRVTWPFRRQAWTM